MSADTVRMGPRPCPHGRRVVIAVTPPHEARRPTAPWLVAVTVASTNGHEHGDHREMPEKVERALHQQSDEAGDGAFGHSIRSWHPTGPEGGEAHEDPGQSGQQNDGDR